MREHLKAFLRFLGLNRNASAHTVRAYDSDLTQFLASRGRRSPVVKVRELQPVAPRSRSGQRGFLGELHAAGLSRATAARKLAAVRTFLRYLRREALIDDDPGGAGARRRSARCACRRTCPRTR